MTRAVTPTAIRLTIDRTERAQRAFVIRPASGETPEQIEHGLAEARGLAEALGFEIVRARSAPLQRPRPSTLFGAGQVEALASELEAAEIDVLIVDRELSPVQQRNLERALKAKVVDRTGVILEIFGLRAQTREGRLQVELARLAYERSRLIRTWTHLERQRGGRGFLAGPGETQIESDRRLLATRMASLRRELSDVRRTRALHRAKRRRIPYPVAALAGYTNAGKSTLFNRLTAADVFVEDMVFATLDPTTRAITLPEGGEALLSDTVGFIAELPTHLVAAFRATLEEIGEANVVVHVRDMSANNAEAQQQDVLETLNMLEAGPEHGQPLIEVWNKIDALAPKDAEHLRQRAKALSDQGEAVVALSALTGEGMEDLLIAIAEAVVGATLAFTVRLRPEEARARAWLHELAKITSEDIDKNGLFTLRFEINSVALGQFQTVFPAIALK